MKALSCQYRITDLYAAFGVSRSGYHRWRTAAPSARTQEDARLGQQLAELHAQSRRTYGRSRLWAALRQHGQRHSQKRVARLLRALGLSGVRRGRFRLQTTESNHCLHKTPNRLLRAAKLSCPDRQWVADLTFISTAEG